MIVHINSYPGVGKLTIAKIVAANLNAKLLDNHSIYNVAFALTEFKTKAFYETVRSVRAIAYERIRELPNDTPVILTNAHADDSAWGNECWDEAVALARACERPHLVVVLDCSREENAKRIQGPDREEKRKPRDPKMFRRQEVDRNLIDRDADALLRFDVTSLSADASARRILDWIESLKT